MYCLNVLHHHLVEPRAIIWFDEIMYNRYTFYQYRTVNVEYISYYKFQNSSFFYAMICTRIPNWLIGSKMSRVRISAVRASVFLLTCILLRQQVLYA